MGDTSLPLFVRLVRLAKGDETYDIDPAIGADALRSVATRRFVMLVRGALLAARTRRLVFPVFVGRGVAVHHPRHLRLNRGVTIEDYCRLDCLGRTGIRLGESVTLRRGVHIEVTSVLRDIGEGCVLGDRVGVSEGTYLGAKGLLTVGADSKFGPQCIVIAENHRFDDVDVPIRLQGVERRGVTIADDCWLGAGVRVVDGVSIGRGSVIGAGSVVTKNIPEYAVAVGDPARVIRSRR
jgi:acetyltransferase-like isoleucine patch superfamily enzyme